MKSEDLSIKWLVAVANVHAVIEIIVINRAIVKTITKDEMYFVLVIQIVGCTTGFSENAGINKLAVLLL